MSGHRDIKRRTDQRTDQRIDHRTDQRTSKGDHYGTHWVNPRSKEAEAFEEALNYLSQNEKIEPGSSYTVKEINEMYIS